MQVNTKTIKNQFEKTMDKYDENALVQKIMAEKLVDSLMNPPVTEFEILRHTPLTSGVNTILELGAGTGLLTKEIVAKIKYKKYFANDLIEKSKKYLDKILPEYTSIPGNAQRIKPSSKVDLIVSNAMFQWFKEIDCAHYANILNSGGIFAFTTFSPKNFCEIKTLTGLSLEYNSIDNLKNILCPNFEIIHAEEFEHKMTFANPLELLAHLKNTGVNSLTKNWTFADVKNFCEKYKETYPEISLTYSPIIIIAQKPA